MNRSRNRRQWLLGSSALAAAIASLSVMPDTAQAQARMGDVTLNRVSIAPQSIPADAQAPAAAPAPAPVDRSVTSIAPVNGIAIQSSTPAPTPVAGSETKNGINVQASANYSPFEINYSPNVASDVIDVLTDSAIINWTTFAAGTAGGQVSFLGNGGQLDFNSNLSEYTVLNRIFTPGVDAAVRIDGTVNSSGISGSPGGNIWFFSPGGLILGGTSVFNVGSLGLTSSTPGAIGASGTTWSFTGTPDPTSAVVIEPGAQITANLSGAYLAVVAPRVVQGGIVNVDGSVAYVGAEQADLTINNGLFDISVGLGSGDANGVVHTGLTFGAAAQAQVNGAGQITNADARGIYMVAVPKNTAINMLVGGRVGYQPAITAAPTANGGIILSAGAEIATGGSFMFPTGTPDTANAVAGGSVTLTDITLTSTSQVFASDTVNLQQSGTGFLFAGGDVVSNYNLDIAAGDTINLAITDLAGMTVGGDLTLRAGGSVNVTLSGDNANPGMIQPPPGSGGLSVGGTFTVDTSARGADDFFTVRNNGGTGIGEDAAAGSINFAVTGDSTLTVGSNLVFDTSAQGGKGEVQNGSGTGGDVTANLSGGDVSIGGVLSIDAGVIAAQDFKIGGNGSGLIGSNSAGGDVSLTLGGTAFSAAGVTLSASAAASTGSDSSAAQSNDAAAGSIIFNVIAGTNQFDGLSAEARAEGADSFDGAGNSVVGAAGRGSIDLTVANAGTSLGIFGGVFLDAGTNGAVALPTGDSVTVRVIDTGPGAGLTVQGGMTVVTSTANGSDIALNSAGSILLEVDNGDLSFDTLNVSAVGSQTGDSFLSTSGNGTDFRAGDVTIRAVRGGGISGGSVFVDAQALGSADAGGDATGGAITLDANNGSIDLSGPVDLLASGRGGAGVDPTDPSQAGIATGGNLVLSVSGAGGVLNLGDFSARVDALIENDAEFGVPPFAGGGGSAFGGSVTFNVTGGLLTANSIDISASGTGGTGGELALPAATTIAPGLNALSGPSVGGFGSDPIAFATLANAPATASGGGAPPTSGLPSAGDGGLGQGGTIVFNLNGGAMSSTDMTLDASGIGGDGASADANNGVRGGSGGDAIGGSVTFNGTSGSLDVTNNLIVLAGANSPFGGGAGGGGAGSEGGDGGNAQGGTASFNLNGTAAITAGNIAVSTDGYGGVGGESFTTFDAMSNILPGLAGGDGGNGAGGNSVYTDTSGSINFVNFVVTARGFGGAGGSSSGLSPGFSTGAAGFGGNASGGTATVNLNQDDATDPTYIVTAAAAGGTGGTGFVGGDGGNATAGTANLIVNNSAIVLANAIISGTAIGGAGGFVDAIGGAAGFGGDATGGTANLLLNGAGSALSSASPVTMTADATGGNGAVGGTGDAAVAASAGGAGGNAVAGTVRIATAGAGTSLTIDSNLVNLSADAQGGFGGQGGSNFSSGGIAGDGGAGGSGAGGSPVIEAGSGTTITLDAGLGDLVLSGTGIGGDGGPGGNIDMLNPGTAGDGGNGGIGTGGSPTLRAIGGTITGTAVTVEAVGIGGNGGMGGTDFAVQLGADGNGGDAFGGTPLFELLDGSPGVISLGDLTVSASGIAGTGTIAGIDSSGLVTFRDLSVEAGGVFSFGSLTVDATGFAAGPSGGGLVFIAGSGTNSIAGDMQVTVTGDITYNFDGGAQIVVGGNTSLNATGDILITHTSNAAPTISIDVGGNFNAFANGDFTAGPTSIINSGGELVVFVSGNIAADDLRAGPFILLTAGGNVALANALAIGPQGLSNSGGIIIDAGFLSSAYDPVFNATITGDVQSYSDITVRAGGSAIFTGTANVAADNILLVQTGDDIIVQSGAALSSANNPVAPVVPAAPFASGPNISLLAGSITNLIGPIPSPISSVVVAGSLDANTGAVILNGNAIDGSGGSIAGSSLSAEINDAPNAGLPQSNDDMLLSASCLEGNVCLGDVSAGNRIEIGQNSNNDVIQLIVEQASITANDVLITTRNDIVMGTSGFPTAVSAANAFSLTSLTGNVNLVDAVVTSNQIAVQAAGSLLGNGSLVSAGDVGITVGQDLSALLIDAGGQLTGATAIGGALEASYSVPGTVDIVTLRQGAGGVNIIAGADNSIDTVELTAPGNVTLVAGNTGPGDVFLGTAANDGAIALTGDNASFTALTPTGAVAITAGTDVTGGSISSGGDIVIGAGGTIVATDIAAAQAGTGVVTVNGASGISLGTLAGNSANLTATTGAVVVGTDVDVTGLVTASGTSVQLVSTNDLNVAATATSGDVDIQTTANLAIAGADATGAITLNAGGGVLISDVVDAGGLLGINAGGLVDVQAQAAGATIDILSSDIDIGASGALGVSGQTGSIALAGTSDITVGGTAGSGASYELDNDEFSRVASDGDVSLSSSGDIALNTLDVAAGAGANIGAAGGLLLNAGGDVDVTGAALMTAAGANNLLSVDAVGTIRVDPAMGSLRVEDAAGALTGQIGLSAARIEVLSAAARADLAGLVAIADINTRLGQNDGIASDNGFISAGSLAFDAGEALLIQNSGTSSAFGDRRGFTANSVSISSTNPSAIIVINGVVGAATGIDAIALTGVPGSFNPGSTINGCTILNTASCRSIGFDDPIRDLIEDIIDPKGSDPQGGRGFDGLLVDMRGSDPLADDPLLDEPVTGAGNEDLWIGGLDCDAPDADKSVCDVPLSGVKETAE